MQRVIEDGVGGALFNHAARVHHRHPVGQFGDRAHVVRDHDDADAELILQLAHQIENLRLHRHVEGGGRLVRDHELRMAAHRHGDHHALPHAARQLVRIGPRSRRRLGNADGAQKLDSHAAGIGLAHILMQQDRFGDLIAHGKHRVERGHRLLEYHRDVAAAQPAHPRGIGADQLFALKPYRTADDPPGRLRDQTHDRKRRDRLAATRLAHDAQGFARVEAEGYAVERRYLAVPRREGHTQVVDFQKTHSAASQLGVERVVHAVADQADGKNGQEDRSARYGHRPPRVEDVIAVGADHHSP